MDIELDFIRFCFTEEQQRSGLTCENMGGDGRNSGKMSNSSCKGHEHFQNQDLKKKRFWTDDILYFFLLNIDAHVLLQCWLPVFGSC